MPLGLTAMMGLFAGPHGERGRGLILAQLQRHLGVQQQSTFAIPQAAAGGLRLAAAGMVAHSCQLWVLALLSKRPWLPMSLSAGSNRLSGRSPADSCSSCWPL